MKQKTFLFVLALLSSLMARAYDAQINGIYYNLNSSTRQATVTYGDTKYIRSVSIPTTVAYNGTTYNVTSIGDEAFSECPTLVSITIPNSVTSIGDECFCECYNLTSITIPQSVTVIADEAFASCPGLSSISVESGNTVYDSRNNCNAIIETATNTLIAGCKNTVIPDGVATIGKSAFFECSNLTSVIIPNSVNTIVKAAFYGCSSLSSVVIGNSVTSIGKEVFYDCSSLKNVYCYAEQVPTATDNAFDSNIANATLHVPEASVSTYQTTSPWSIFGSIVAIGDDVEDPNPLLLGTWRYDFGTNSYILLNFSQDGTVRYQEYDKGGWEHDELYSYSFSNNKLKITDSYGNVMGEIEVLTLTSNTLMLKDWPDEGVSTFAKQNGSNIESAVLNGSIIGQWSIVSDLYTRYDNDVIVSQEEETLTPPYDRIAFYDNGTIEYLEYSRSNNSYHEDGKGTYTIVDNKFVYGGGDWDNVTITAFDGSNTMEAYCQFSEDKGSKIVRKVHKVTLQRVTDGGEPSEKCATPTISFVNGKLEFSCETEGVEFVAKVTCPDAGEYEGSSIPLTSAYIVTVYAKKDGYEDSDVATKEITVGGSTGIKGDVNEDGTVNGTDIQEVINIIVQAD